MSLAVEEEVMNPEPTSRLVLNSSRTQDRY
jgi:hypothetical protein